LVCFQLHDHAPFGARDCPQMIRSGGPAWIDGRLAAQALVGA
jgi:hypothetical protein